MLRTLTARNDGPVEAQIRQILRAIRTHLGMDIGFVSEFADGRRSFRYVDAAGANPPIAVGASDPLEESYCHFVATGVFPELMHDAAEVAGALAMPVTTALPVGAHLSTPIRLDDHSVFGTLCCFSYQADRSLNDRDLSLLKVFADLIGKLISSDLSAKRKAAAATARIEQVIETKQFSILYQPIYRVRDDSLAGFEALSRFSAKPQRSPDRWFAEAAEAGIGVKLEFATVREACAGLLFLAPSISLAVNLSPQAILSPGFDLLFEDLPVHRLVLEITEHAAVEDYTEIQGVLRPLRQRGLRLAVDDAGAGHSSFKHVLDLQPELVKLDMSLTRGIDRDPGRRALARALTGFGREMGCQIVAEGVETEMELEALRLIGVTKVQGYLVGRPMPLPNAAALPPFRPSPRYAGAMRSVTEHR